MLASGVEVEVTCSVDGVRQALTPGVAGARILLAALTAG